MNAFLLISGALLLGGAGAYWITLEQRDSQWTSLGDRLPEIKLPTTLELPTRDQFGNTLPRQDMVLAVMPSCESCSRIPMAEDQIIQMSPLPVVFVFPDKDMHRKAKTPPKGGFFLTLATWRPPVELWQAEGSLIRLDPRGRIMAVSSSSDFSSFLKEQRS